MRCVRISNNELTEGAITTREHVQLKVETLTDVLICTLSLMSNHKMMLNHFGSRAAGGTNEGKEMLNLLNSIANKVMDGPQPNLAFGALLRCLGTMPDSVEARGSEAMETYKTLLIRCLSKLTKAHYHHQNEVRRGCSAMCLRLICMIHLQSGNVAVSSCATVALLFTLPHCSFRRGSLQLIWNICRPPLCHQ